jgi:hypothetical protein
MTHLSSVFPACAGVPDACVGSASEQGGVSRLSRLANEACPVLLQHMRLLRPVALALWAVMLLQKHPAGGKTCACRATDQLLELLLCQAQGPCVTFVGMRWVVCMCSPWFPRCCWGCGGSST